MGVLLFSTFRSLDVVSGVLHPLLAVEILCNLVISHDTVAPGIRFVLTTPTTKKVTGHFNQRVPRASLLHSIAYSLEWKHHSRYALRRRARCRVCFLSYHGAENRDA